MAVCDARMLFRILKFVFLWAVMFLGFNMIARAQTDLSKIVGPNACAECHKEEALVWQKTHHFTTFKDMPRSKEARKITDKMGIKRVKAKSLCLNCHFTSQAATANKRPKPIAGISCESCHSAGKDWEKLHAEFSGNKKKEDETKAQATARWKKSEALGMIRPHALYSLAKNCYSCHVVPQEKLVNVGGHPAGSKFELVSWSQGEVRHNLWYSKGKENVSASRGRKRMMYIVGLAVELETALRAVGVATLRKSYAFKMARRADVARKKMAVVAKLVPGVREVANIIKLGHSAGLKLRNNARLSAAADGIAKQTLSLVANYDGSTFAGLDRIIPGADKYKGKPPK
ncbi:perchlorate reductase subunit gamma [bacterium MnTg02]|nr:perchlorate reductase subunit gamma [bacterium MnTg02]